MRKHVFKDVELEAFAHATESPEAVERALRLFAPHARLEREVLGGHFGQSLVALRALVREPEEIAETIARIRSAVGPQVARSAARRIDHDLRLHFRFDKQRAARGEIALDPPPEHDIVKLRIRLRGPGLSRAGAVALVQGEFGGATPREEE